MTVRILYGPDCPLVARVRETVARCIEQLERQGDHRVIHAVEEIRADYPSPTVLVDGADVMGSRPLGTSCRLDLPTVNDILAAVAHRGNVG